MKPVGLTLTNIKIDRYTGKSSGELAIVHMCLGCGKVSTNRIAGDDNTYTIECLLSQPGKQITPNCCIKLLTLEDKHIVLAALFGHDHDKYMK